MLRLAREFCAFFTQQAKAYKIEYETQFLINQIIKLNIISISNKLKETKACLWLLSGMWTQDNNDSFATNFYLIVIPLTSKINFYFWINGNWLRYTYVYGSAPHSPRYENVRTELPKI